MNRNRINQLLQTALGATTNGVLITDNTIEDNPIIYVNAGFETMTGYQTNEILGRNCRFLQGEGTDFNDVARLREAIKTGKDFRVELLNYKKDGTPFWNDLSIAPVKDEEGNVTHFVGIQSDITDRKEKEKARRAQLMAENVVDTIREPIAILNEDFTIHSVNKSFYNLFKTTPEQTVGKHLYEIEEGYLSIPALRTLLENILPQKNPFEDFELTHDFPRIGTKTLLLNARRLDREQERPEYILLAIEDVTRFKESENALFESERRSRFIIEGLKDLAVVTTDTSGNVTTWNSGAQNILGYEESEIVGQNIAALLSSTDEERSLIEDELQTTIRQGQVHKDRSLVRKDGAQIWALSLLSVLHDEQGHLQGFAILLYDQTMRKQLEEELALRAEELATRDRAKDQFLAMLGHELRNPLAAISNAINVAQMLGTQENIKHPLEIADRQIEHINRLVGDLLDVARVTQGKITLKKERVALDEIVAGVTRNLQRLADAKKLKVHLALDTKIFVNGDTLRLEQIVSNLVTNAIKYTEAGEVTIEVHAHKDEALLIVRDTGMGIDPQLLPRLFDLFSQADRTLARSEGGLGVGLTIVKQLVELHGGRIEAHSKGKDKGSVFRVTLPLDTSSSHSAHSSSSKTASKSNARLKILVVEDHPDIAEMSLMMLQLWNYHAIKAGDGEEAVAVALEEHPDVVLLDIGLPKMNGYEVARRLRERFPSSEMKLISLTGYALREDEERALEAGFDKHLAKPVEFGVLRETLSAFEAELKKKRRAK